MGKLAKKGKRSKLVYVTNEAQEKVPEVPVVETVTIPEEYKMNGYFLGQIYTTESKLSLDCSNRTNVLTRIYQVFRFIFTGKFIV